MISKWCIILVHSKPPINRYEAKTKCRVVHQSRLPQPCNLLLLSSSNVLSVQIPQSFLLSCLIGADKVDPRCPSLNIFFTTGFLLTGHSVYLFSQLSSPFLLIISRFSWFSMFVDFSFIIRAQAVYVCLKLVQKYIQILSQGQIYF